MTNIDYGRQKDLEELTEAMQNARTTGERTHYEKIAYRILNESPKIRYLREQLIQSTRAGDNNSSKKILLKIQYARQQETNGASWGNNKGNRYVN